jgi:hypothetical protein
MLRTNSFLPVLLALAVCSESHAKTFFLDNKAGVVNGSETYDPATRTWGKGNDKVFTEPADATNALAGGDTLYVRAGTGWPRRATVAVAIRHARRLRQGQ